MLTQYAQRDVLCLHLSDIPLSRNATQGLLKWGLRIGQDPCEAGSKILGPVGIPQTGCLRHQAIVNPSKQVKSGETASGDSVFTSELNTQHEYRDVFGYNYHKYSTE